jgi:hypothetical protein
MLLDVNGLEHTDLAVHRRQGERLLTQHLIAGLNAAEHMDLPLEAGHYHLGFRGCRTIPR